MIERITCASLKVNNVMTISDIINILAVDDIHNIIAINNVNNILITIEDGDILTIVKVFATLIYTITSENIETV